MYRSQIQKQYAVECPQPIKLAVLEIRNFVWVACHVNPRLEQKFMTPGGSYSGPYMIPDQSWHDHGKEICMICLLP